MKTVGAASLSLALSRKGESMPEPRKPNLVYVLADQLRYQSCGFAGDPNSRTPNLDAFCRESAHFRNAVSGHPVCAAYRASLFTGKYTTSTGMVINELRMNPNHECLAHVLTRNGYDTSYIGKWHLWANQLGNHRDPKNSFTPPGPYRLGFDGFWASYGFNHEYYQGYYHTDSPEQIPAEGYEPDFQTNLAIERIEHHAHEDKPFAVFLSVGAPHSPWRRNNVPPEYLSVFDGDAAGVGFDYPPNYKPENDPYADNWGIFKNPKDRASLLDWMRVYYAMTANLDWNFSRLMRALDEAGVRDNTIVVFTSDHGDMLGSQGRLAKNIFYEEAARVPFLIRLPGKTTPGLVTDACLNTPDIMPTLLSMMGLPIPAKVEGADLSHCVLGKRGPEPEAAFMQNTGACASWEDGYEWRALRSKRYTYAVYRRDHKELLFDNRNDPYQLHNLADTPESRLIMKRFRGILERRMKELDDGFEASTWYRDNWTRDRIITRVR